MSQNQSEVKNEVVQKEAIFKPKRGVFTPMEKEQRFIVGTQEDHFKFLNFLPPTKRELWKKRYMNKKGMSKSVLEVFNMMFEEWKEQTNGSNK